MMAGDLALMEHLPGNYYAQAQQVAPLHRQLPQGEAPPLLQHQRQQVLPLAEEGLAVPVGLRLGPRAKAVDPEDLGRLRALLAEEGFGPIVAHAPYIMNPCSKDPG